MSARAVIPVVATLVLLLAGCSGGGNDGGSDAKRSSAKDDGAPSGTTTTTTPSATTEDDLPIVVTSPSGFQSVYRSFLLKGEAAVHEGTVAWELLGPKQVRLAKGTVQAGCGGPCRGKFSTEVDVSKVEPGSWELHVFQPPVADGDPPRAHDYVVPITITTGPIDPDDPGPDAPPPGGLPTG